MPNTPIDEHTDEFEQLAGLSALGVLEGDERARFEAHAAECERCRLMVRLDVETLARVSLLAPAMDPSPDFKARLMRRAAEELEQKASAASAPAATQPASPEGVQGAEPVQRAEPIRLRPRPTNVVS